MFRWAGDRCTEPGAVCEGDYACRNDGSCERFRQCRCPPEWKGDQCTEAVCKPGCSPVGGTCSSTPGACRCLGQHTGETCSDCKDGYYPDDDTLVCVQKKTEGFCDRFDTAAVYNPTTDVCDCTDFAWYFPRCDRRCPKCSPGFRQTGGCLGLSGVQCGICSKCTDGETYAAGGCDGGTQDTSCESCSLCSPGTFYSGGCVGGIDTICKSRLGVLTAEDCDGICHALSGHPGRQPACHPHNGCL
jgi:hypothetical protein